jgi:hypothetical protein
MYEEDRLRALQLYEDIFDETGNETAVLQLLVSPTRQAVNLARAYDAKERRFQTDSAEAPAFEQVIDEIREQAQAIAPSAPRYDADQISLFAPSRPQESEENYFDNFGFDNLPAFEENDRPRQTVFREFSAYPDEDRASDPVPASPPPVIVPEETEPDKPEREEKKYADSVEAFLADFSIQDDLLAEEPEPDAPAEAPTPEEEEWIMPRTRRRRPETDFVWSLPDEDPISEPAAPVHEAHVPAHELRTPTHEIPTPAPEKSEPEPPVQEQTAAISVQEEAPPPMVKKEPPVIPDLPAPPKRRLSVPLLILFLLLAIPVGLCCASILIGAAGASACAAGTVLWTGLHGFALAFSFSIFADFLLVFGMSLACTAIGILLLWLFVWLLIGAIPGLVRGLSALARKLCYKEVAA